MNWKVCGSDIERICRMSFRSTTRIPSVRNSYLVTLMPLSRQVRDSAQALVDMNMKDMVSGHGKARQMGSAAKYTMHSSARCWRLCGFAGCCIIGNVCTAALTAID